MSDITLIFAKRLTFDTVQAERKRVLDAINKKNSLVLDLSLVEKFDSAGLALLIEANRICKRYNIALFFKNIPETFISLAKFCGVEELLI